MRPRGGIGMRMMRAGMHAERDPRGYTESNARPGEVTPDMRMNSESAHPELSPTLMPHGSLNDKMNGE